MQLFNLPPNCAKRAFRNISGECMHESRRTWVRRRVHGGHAGAAGRVGGTAIRKSTEKRLTRIGPTGAALKAAASARALDGECSRATGHPIFRTRHCAWGYGGNCLVLYGSLRNCPLFLKPERQMKARTVSLVSSLRRSAPTSTTPKRYPSVLAGGGDLPPVVKHRAALARVRNPLPLLPRLRSDRADGDRCRRDADRRFLRRLRHRRHGFGLERRFQTRVGPTVDATPAPDRAGDRVTGRPNLQADRSAWVSMARETGLA